MASRPEDTDLLMDDFLFHETDAFALPLLDFDPDGALLTPAELSMPTSMTHQQQTQALPFPDEADSGSYQPTSPVSTDDGSTDAEVSTPPPAFVQRQQQPQFGAETDVASSPAAKVSLLGSMHSPLPSEQKLLAPRTCNSSSNYSTTTPTSSAKSMQQKPMMQAQTSTPFPGVLPYAMPVAYFPPPNVNQRRPCPQVLPGSMSPNAASPTAAALPATAAESDPNAKKSKREIRQMKNRESANKSRLRRKAQLSTLTTEVAELKNKEQELQTIIAGLRAENKSLLDQNTFLRSLVTSFKQEPSCQSNHPMTAFASLPPPVDQNCVALNMLESGKMNCEMQAEPMDMTTTRPGKRRAVTSTLSTASMAVCASVFGITVFADYDGGAGDSGTIRGVGRVLHEAPTACGMEGCSTDGSLSMLGYMVAAVRSWWQFVSSSELVFGVLLNVLSFIAIVAVYQLWQSHSVGEWSWKYPMLSKSERRSACRQAELKADSDDEKKRNPGIRDVRLRDKLLHGKSSSQEAVM
ncbi:hypothetical protein PF005_g12715 [Phytophthora fragariae]|uniref:BZIP domain-containing protein n=3 Tax=Phytophthora TaxID=4783 RepID=A0A6A3S8Y5_9STRA|nr:hypothetical protein PF003_g55 [Phytophthora fragariae]KAE8938398.1 hypothetical protein PF009_g11729 [Phytophthora fragariae]KAE9009043.1 hypothetical protein PF011_g10456 [Phytophthora fragariae]KAE9107357.1 hypothetical protein PF010_g12293 [Phytophthora fragariae]KAE9111595.1 hypothetical protein PF007_g11431 [Phytophthora fragariae]